jgi:hypothetical protein
VYTCVTPPPEIFNICTGSRVSASGEYRPTVREKEPAARRVGCDGEVEEARDENKPECLVLKRDVTRVKRTFLTLLTLLAALCRASGYSDACIAISGKRKYFNGIFVTRVKPM